MKKILALIFITFSLLGFSQQDRIDSLNVKINTTYNDVDKIELYKTLCKILNKKKHPSQSIKIYNKALSLAIKLKDKKFEARLYRYLHVANKKEGKNKLAIEYLNKALNIDKSINNIEGVLLDSNLLGAFYIDTQNYNKAIKLLTNSVENYKEKDSINTICVIYTNLGIAYMENQNWEKAVKSLHKAIDFSKKLQSFEDKNFALHQLGVAYMLQGNYKEAEKFFLKSLSDSIHVKYPAWRNANNHALAYNYWCLKEYKKSIKYGKLSEMFNHKTGNAYQEFEDIRYQVQSYNYLGEYDKAIETAKRGLKLKDKISFKDLIYALKVNMSTSYLFSNNYDKAEKYLHDVLKYIEKNKDARRINRQRLFKNYSILYEKKKKFDKALIYYKKYSKQNEKELIQQRDNKISDIEAKLQKEQKERELAEKKHELQQITIKKQKLLIATISISGISIIILFFLVNLYLKNKRNYAKLQKTISEIKELKKQLFSSKSNKVYRKKDFHIFLMNKFGINKIELIEVWESIVNGESRKDFAIRRNISENTIKSWRNQLYNALKQNNNTKRYGDHLAVNEYFRQLIKYKYK